MLEKLGNTLKKARDKLANAVFLDKNLVDQIVRDLQRALIEADVNIKLVKQITDKIKKEAFDERIKDVEKKEHLVKLLYDELVKILGESKELELDKGQERIMLLGLYGAGKCVHKNTNVQLSSGEMIQAKDLYERHSEGKVETELEDGRVIDVSKENLLVPSYNPRNQKIETKKATHLWKLEKQDLVEVKLDNGNDYSVKVTPEHPFFTLENGQVKKARADELTGNEYIAVPNTTSFQGRPINLFDKIRNLDLDAYLDSERARNHLPKEKSLKKIHESLTHGRNYCQFTLDIKKGKVPVGLMKGSKESFLTVKNKNGKSPISFPLFLGPEFAEFLGYFVGDGNMSKRYVQITNEDREVIERVKYLSKSLFNITPSVKKDKRSKNLYDLNICSSTLVDILSKFCFFPGRKGKDLSVPREIMLSNNDVVRSFIKAYFDCDSYPSKNKRHIELFSESNPLVRQMHMLLKRFGILSSISKKIVKGLPYWRLIIKAKYAEIYADKIGYGIKRKKERVENYVLFGDLQGSGNQDMVPLGKSLKTLRLQLGFSVGEIQSNAVSSYGIYENKGLISKANLKKLLIYYRSKKKGIIRDFLQGISEGNGLRSKYSHSVSNSILHYLESEGLVENENGQVMLKERGRETLKLIEENEVRSNELLDSFEFIADSNVCWLPLREVDRIKNDSGFVYDLTVEDNHSFIADGFIVHNTTTIAKLGNYYSKRGKKVALVGLDVHRPAAKEQLQQLGQEHNMDVFVDMDKDDAVETWKDFEDQGKFKDYDLVLVDTAGRHTLDEDLVREIENLNDVVKPKEKILVMPADVGQAAKKQAEEFQSSLDVSGVIITKMDSTAKAGGALTACYETGSGIYFITTGEKVNDIETFDPESFLSRVLGMGDLKSLLEKVQSASDSGKQQEMQERLQEGKITLDDVIEQVKSMSSMGGMSKLKSMVPGMSKAKIPDEEMESQEHKVQKWQHIVNSMTKYERENADIFEKETSRIRRVAKGSGVNRSDVRALLKQYKMLKEMVKDTSMSGMDPSQGMSQKQLQKMMKKFSKGKFRM